MTELPDSSLKLAVIVVLSAVGLAIFILRRYGSVWKKLTGRLGRNWPRIIQIVSISTLALWAMYWIMTGPEQREELKRYFQESAPWVIR